MKQVKSTHVYILGFSDGVIKPGRTSNMDNRTRQHAKDALIRRATITNSWSMETEHPNRLERLLLIIAGKHLEKLSGTEWFAGDFDSFIPLVELDLRRWGVLPAEKYTFREVMQKFDVSANELCYIRSECGLTQWFPQLATANFEPSYFLKEEADAWFANRPSWLITDELQEASA